MTDRYAVIGNPIDHSKSPEIHTAFARQTGQDLTYERILGEPGAFEPTVRRFFDAGGAGLNVTVPFKLDAMAFADALSPRAELAGAVNTLSRQADGVILGDNTDGAGLVRDLAHNNGVVLSGRDVLLLGAGGAVRGVLGPLLDQQPGRIVIANRTVDKAANLAQMMPGPVAGCGFEDLDGQAFDLIINGTAAGLSGELPPLPDGCLREGGTTYDMMYASEPTAFVRWGGAHGAGTALDGLGMLIEQAAESFRIWRGVRPDTRPVFGSLRPASQ